MDNKILDTLDDLLKKLADESIADSTLRELELSAFLPAIGRSFEPARALMVVGKATNGWDAKFNAADMSSKPKRSAVIQKAQIEAGSVSGDGVPLSPPDGLSWVRKDWLGENSEPYSKTSFWFRIRDIVQKLESKDPDNWFDKIVWTNFYKIAPADRENSTGTGNPTGRLEEMQSNGDWAFKFLRTEIATMKPRRILIVTGWLDWWPEQISSIGKCALKEVGGPDFRSLAGSLTVETHSVPVVITRHPQGAYMIPYVEGIVGAFGSLE